jgi:epoxyqueuosine reductase
MNNPDSIPSPIDYVALGEAIKKWAKDLGFQQTGFTSIDLSADEAKLETWLARHFHGSMHYMQKHGTRRSRPNELHPGTIRVISVRMDYLPNAQPMQQVLDDASLAYVSRYALGRDYHKVLRQRLKALAQRISQHVGDFDYRVFTDSAPVLEKPLARNAGLGWIGKHTNLINHGAGSWFFLGEIYTDLPLPIDLPATDHCGTCTRCISACPTQAIVAPYQLDARRCISYLTIELDGSIPEEFRKPMGNRIYGCDDCQLVCPWNKFAQLSAETDFRERHGLGAKSLIELFAWSESDFLHYTEGSAIRRIGYLRWLRNIAVALGNAPSSSLVIQALQSRQKHPSDMLREHVDWALQQHELKVT